jgi:hypothetical protein
MSGGPWRLPPTAAPVAPRPDPVVAPAAVDILVRLVTVGMLCFLAGCVAGVLWTQW